MAETAASAARAGDGTLPIRDAYWDSLKFVLIALVVYGHFVHLPAGRWTRAVYLCIYMFHMPLFVFVSGRFSRIRDRTRYWRGICRLLETFLVFHAGWALVLFAGGVPLGELLTKPVSPYWYLPALACWRTGVALSTRRFSPGGTQPAHVPSSRRIRGILLGSVCISLLVALARFRWVRAALDPVSRSFRACRKRWVPSGG